MNVVVLFPTQRDRVDTATGRGLIEMIFREDMLPGEN